MKYFLKNKIYSSLSSLYEEYEDEIPCSIATVRNRLKEGLSLEDALFNEKKKTASYKGSHTVEGKDYKSLADIADAYGIARNSLYKRYSRGSRGDDLVPLKKRKSYLQPVKEIFYKLTIDGKGFRSEAEACRYFGVKYVTYRKRKYQGYSPKECLGLEPILDKRTLRKGTKINKPPKDPVRLQVEGKVYTSYATLAREYNLPVYVVYQRIKTYGYTPVEAVKMRGKSTQVIVEGKTYKSMAEASRAYGKSSNSVATLMNSGLTIDQALGVQNYKTTHTLLYKGVYYNSRADLAKSLELTPSKLASRLKSGLSLDEAIASGDRIINKGKYNKTSLERDRELASKNAVTYFVKILIGDRELYKVGITTQSVKKRLGAEKYQIISVYSGPLIDCFNFEQMLLKIFSHKRVSDITGGHLDGYTEILDLTSNDIHEIQNYFIARSN